MIVATYETPSYFYNEIFLLNTSSVKGWEIILKFLNIFNQWIEYIY